MFFLVDVVMFFNMLVSAQANQLVRENQKGEEEGEGLMATVSACSLADFAELWFLLCMCQQVMHFVPVVGKMYL